MTKYMNKKTGIIAGIMAVVIVAAIIIAPRLSQALTLDQAKEIAKNYVPSTAQYVKSEEEENKYEVMFRDDTKQGGYEVEVYKDSKKVKKVEFQRDDDRGSKDVKINKAEVKNIVEKNFTGVKSIKVRLTKDDGLYKYEADFTAEDYYGDAEISPSTGEILESTVKYGSAVVIPKDTEGDSSDIISFEKAESLAKKEANGGFVKDISFEEEDGEYYYEVEIVKDGMEYDYLINAKTGEVMVMGEYESYFDYDDDDDDYVVKKNESAKPDKKPSGDKTNSGLISESKARNIVLSKIPGAKIRYIKLEKDDGRYVYEGEAVLGKYEYEFEINASSGVIIDWGKDLMDKYEYDDDDDDWDDD